MFTLFLIVLALFVGWATPQPEFAKKLTDSVVAKFKELTNKEKNDFDV